jgi:drug/metabolite transporter (DMT)-like permease
MSHPPSGSISAVPPVLSLVTASALWGVATVISKAVLASVPPVPFLVLQLAPSVVLLWGLVLLRGGARLPAGTLAPMLLLGVLNPGLSYTLSMLGLARTTASVATLLWAAEPALIAVLAWPMLRERLRPGLVAIIAAAACGVLLVSGLAGGAVAAGDPVGDMLVLGGVLCCALYTVLSRRLPAMDLLAVVAVQESAGLVSAVALWRLGPVGVSGGHVALSGAAWVGGVVSGVMYYATAFWFWLAGLRAVPASVAGLFLNLVPVFGIATAWVALGERLAAAQWTGAAIILASIMALLVSRMRQV